MLFSVSAAGKSAAMRMSRPEGSQAAWRGGLADAQAQTQSAGAFRDFGLLSRTDGWILVGQSLYWTTSSGTDWVDITPVLPAAAAIHAVYFLDAQTGWILWGESRPDGSLVLKLESTSDQGGAWSDSVIQEFASGDPEALVENASMDWLDADTGWIVVKQSTGSNFSAGSLFSTTDGGQSWQQLVLPVGEPVHFVDSQVGWTAGGPAGNQIFKTRDGGNTWQEQSPPAGLAGNQNYFLYPPLFDNLEDGLLAALTLNGSDFQLEFLKTGDGGQSWQPLYNFSLGSQGGRLPVSLVDASNLVVAVPNSDRLIIMADGTVSITLNQDGMSAAIVDLKMPALDFGWAKWSTGGCTTQTDEDGSRSVSCDTTTHLIKTNDGGITWETIEIPPAAQPAFLPRSQAASIGVVQAEAVSAGKTLAVMGQGFDICTIPTLAQLQGWWNSSPYTSVNLYIGGAARACPNPTLTADYVTQMRQQGWTFIPTWVGPQAPCTNYIKRFSYDVGNAYVQGRDEAYLAAATLAQLGLTYEDMTGSVVYYDMEHYSTTDTACREAAKSFMNGWVTRLHELGNLAGVYGSTLCNTGLSDYLTIANIPDVIWPARWYLSAPLGTYDPNASVWDIGTCIPATAWNNHQRIRQYAGDHTETWGGVTLYSIDSDVLDGVVAVPFFGSPSPKFTALQVLSPALTVQFTIANTAFMATCTWDYGDGQTGNSCANIHTHTYANFGTYTVKLTVSSSWGSENLSSSLSVTLKPATTTTITSDLPDPSLVGQTVTIRYSVGVPAPGSGTPTGNVTVSDGTQSCTGTVAAGSCAISFTTAGTKALTATYAGDSKLNGSLSTPATSHTVNTANKSNTTTTITSDLPDPSVIGQPVAINYSVAVVAPGTGTPTGNVTVSDGAQSCTGTVAAGSCSISFTSTGSKSITASYAGDANFNSSSSSTAAHAVNKASTTTTITSDLPDPSVVGQAVTINYSVAVVAPGSGSPSGNVTVSDGTQSCTGTVAAGKCSIAFASAGAKTLTAAYAGGTNFNSSSSSTAAHTVNKAATTTRISSDEPDPSAVGQVVTIQYTVQAVAPGTGTPTGNVTVSNGTQSCTGTVAAGICSISFSTEEASAIFASYAGDGSYSASISLAVPHNTPHLIYIPMVTRMVPPGAFGKTSPANAASGVGINPILSWETSSEAASYEYCYATTSGCTSWTSVGTNTSATLSGLNNNTTYYWQVRAVNAGGTTPANGGTYWSFTTIAVAPGAFSKANPPNAASGVAINPVLNWGTSSGAASYEYCYATTSGCTTWTSTGTNASVTLSGLSNNTTYYWQVRAVNAGGTTPANGSTYWSFTTIASAPGAFNKNSPANAASGVAVNPTLSWGTSSNAASYEYCYATTSGCTTWTSAGTNTSATLSGLNNNTTYYWQVRAVNTGGTTPANGGTYWSFTTIVAAPGAFSKTSPANAASGVVTNPTLSWGTSSNATTYEYCYATTSGCTTWTSAGTNTSVTLSGLANNTTYYWQARAVNAGGTTQADTGTYWSFTTILAAPGAFSKTSPANAATGVTTRPTLNWAASSGATSYEYCYAVTSDCTTWISAGTSTSVTLSGLSNSKVYYWQVRAVNAVGTTLANTGTYWSFTTAAFTLPGAFSKTSPTNAASGVATNPTLSWGTSSDAVSYEYCYSISTGCTSWIPVGAGTSFTLSGLSNKTTYYWQVRAVNAGGNTQANDGTYWSFTTIAAAPGAFNKTSPANAAIGVLTSPTLSWGASSGAASYEYCYATSSGCTTWTSAGTSTSVALSGLNNGQIYYWQVRAVNAGGTTLANSGTYWSFTTIVAAPGAFSKTSPANGAMVSTTPILTWASSSAATSYQYCYSVANGCTNWISVGAGTSIAISGLSTNTTYYWQVRAVNAGGATQANNGTYWSFTTVSGAGSSINKTDQ